ncbi:Hsp70 family protein [Candidatus Poribacteria bacterium]|nr:Hsp70 family protein [Candidatus Poribacteria bacterium]
MKIPIGVDLGTTYSAIAMMDEHGKPTLILNAEGERITPSAILFEGGEVIVGSDAKRAAISDADRVVLFVKRQMGKADWFFEVDGRRWTAPELSAEILKKLKRDAEERLGASIQEVVITVPAYFADRERTATLQAAELAGLTVLRLINEPTAAALAFGLYHPLPSPPAPLEAKRAGERGEAVRGSKALVFDLGGGTFDVTLLEVEGETMRVLATDGDVYLGGKDWDDQVVNFVATAFESRFGFDPRSEAESYQDLRDRCERAKEQLSQLVKTSINCNYGGHSLRVELPRERFEPLTAALLAQTESTVNLVLQTAGVTWTDVGTVLLSGGSTRMPQVRAMLKRISGKEPNASVDPDECVAKGAAIQAALLLHPPLSPRERGGMEGSGVRALWADFPSSWM